jgi:hypothetical protein
MLDFVAPLNTFPSQSLGPSGEQMYWAPLGSLYPVCPENIDKQKVKKIFNQVTLNWANIVMPVDPDVFDAAQESERGLEILKQEAFDQAIPFIAISQMPLDEDYFEDNFSICYFASEPHKID